MERRGRSTAARWACALTVLAALAGCSVPAPDGEGPLRYRDFVFPEVTQTPDVEYAEVPGIDGTPQKLYMDQFQPAGDTAARRPAVIWMHGGGFATGTRKSPDMVSFATKFAQRGYVAVSISYRLMAAQGCGGAGSTGRCAAAAIYAKEDEQAAVRYLRAHADELRIDPERIAIAGASAGAVAGTLTASTPDIPGSSGNDGYRSDVRGLVAISGGIPGNAFFTPGDAPILFLHGTADLIVPYAWAASNATYMLNNGLLAILHPYAGANHVPYQYQVDMDEQARNFLYLVMDLGNAEDSGVARTVPRTLTGTGTETLRTVTLKRAALVRWTGTRAGVTVRTRSGRTVLRSKARKGMAIVPAGTYSGIRVQASGRWSVSLP